MLDYPYRLLRIWRVFQLCAVTALFNDHPRPEREVVKQSRSEKLFYADNDPLFVQAARIGDLFYFVSYLGIIHEINVGGETSA